MQRALAQDEDYLKESHYRIHGSLKLPTPLPN
jgi:hypothetical protein